MDETSTPRTACSCCDGAVILLACSGASNVGHLSDLAVRELVRRGVARMGCLAGVAGGHPATRKALQEARWIVVLDGCEGECGRHCVTQAGYQNVSFLRADVLGMKRGITPVDEQNVRRLADAVCGELAKLPKTPGSGGPSEKGE